MIYFPFDFGPRVVFSISHITRAWLKHTAVIVLASHISGLLHERPKNIISIEIYSPGNPNTTLIPHELFISSQVVQVRISSTHIYLAIIHACSQAALRAPP